MNQKLYGLFSTYKEKKYGQRVVSPGMIKGSSSTGIFFSCVFSALVADTIHLLVSQARNLAIVLDALFLHLSPTQLVCQYPVLPILVTYPLA